VTGPLAWPWRSLILAAVGLAVLQFGDPDRPWQGAVVMTAAALAVTTPRYQWYALLVMLVVMLVGRVRRYTIPVRLHEWLAFAAGRRGTSRCLRAEFRVPGPVHTGRRHPGLSRPSLPGALSYRLVTREPNIKRQGPLGP
jgi:hypothetical protein